MRTTPSATDLEAALQRNCTELARRLFEAQADRINLLKLHANQRKQLDTLSARVQKLERQVSRSANLEKSKLGRLQRWYWSLRKPKKGST